MSNLFKEKLKGSRIGVFFLTGAPIHLGHYQNIMQAKRENDGCVVVISGYRGDRGDEIGLPLQKRFRYARELFAQDKEVYVTYVDETGMPEYPHGWTPWFDKVELEVEKSVEDGEAAFVWYVGELDYVKELKERISDQDKVVLLDRSTFPISGTAIRENPFTYWNYITRPFRRHFSNNILVAGTASGGKTTLVRDLARSFGAPFTDEYARRYEEESNISDEELVASDFQYLASGQFDNNRQTIQSPANNGLFIADTNVTVTKMYSEIYLSPEDHQRLLPGYEMLEKRERWDLILVVPPVTKYVDDGFRDMRQSEDSKRWEMHHKLISMLQDNGWGDRLYILDAKPDSRMDEQGFYARYKDARQAIKVMMAEKYGVDLDIRADL